MNTIKEAFEANFEQSTGDIYEAEFIRHGRGYIGKWDTDTMAMFLLDLESVEMGYQDQITELESDMEDLRKEKDSEIKELEEKES